MNSNPAELRKTGKALCIVAIILAVLGFLAAVVGASVFTMRSATPLVSMIGEICFLGFLPTLFLAGLSGVGGILLCSSSDKLHAGTEDIQPIDETDDEELY